MDPAPLEFRTTHDDPPREIRVDTEGDEGYIRLGSRWNGEWFQLTPEEARRVAEELLRLAEGIR